MERELTPQQSSDAEIARLEALAARDPGSLAFPALAEAHRACGRPEQAEWVARQGLDIRPDLVAGRLALGLALLDQGRVDEAQREFEQALGGLPDPPFVLRGLERREAAPESPVASNAEPPLEGPMAPALEEEELERAFEDARPVEDEVIDADRIAQEAMRQVDLEQQDSLRPSPDSPFATHTVAQLLDSQGDDAGAAAIRATLEQRERPEPAPARSPASSSRRRTLSTLESWLAKLATR